MQYHPDRNKAPDAEARFKEIAEACGVLSDPRKRAEYDARGIAGVAGFTPEDLFGGIDFGDILGDAGFGLDLGFGAGCSPACSAGTAPVLHAAGTCGWRSWFRLKPYSMAVGNRAPCAARHLRALQGRRRGTRHRAAAMQDLQGHRAQDEAPGAAAGCAGNYLY